LEANFEKYLLRLAKRRAKHKGVEFSLNEEDINIPECCPVLGIVLDKTRRGERRGFPNPACPTIDRLDPSKGYVRENITVVSWRANALKKDGTVEEFEKLLEWMKSQ
jgi:hypothetical protein